MSILLAVLIVASTYRLTRLLVVDEFPPIAYVREWITVRAGEASSLAYLVHCPWCTSVYVGALVVAGTDWLTDYTVMTPALLIAVASAVSGLIAATEPA